MKTKLLQQDIWRSCLHEAAHVITAKKLNGWNTSASASVDIAGGTYAIAIMPRGLEGFKFAAAVAAGDYGSKLSRLFPMPKRSTKTPPANPATVASIRARAVAKMTKAYKKTIRENTDDETVARFCIIATPGDPKEWVRVFRRVHATARLMTWTHRQEIAETACILFQTGSVILKGTPEHNEFHASNIEKLAIKKHKQEAGQ